jgi:Flp pilus assembly protein TadD
MKTFRPVARVWLLLTVALGLGLTACQSIPLIDTDVPALAGHPPVEPAPSVDVLAMTPQMQAFLDRYVLPYDNEQAQVSLLMLAVADQGVLGFHYNHEQTLTAQHAFEKRSGNCVAFANLMIALARAAGLDAHYQEVQLDPVWSNRGETLMVTKHINVVVTSSHYAYTLDVSGQDISGSAPRRKLTDPEALALYYNNLGAEALVGNDFAQAYAWFSKAVNTAPGRPDPWSNLGVLFARNNQPDAAEAVYRQALRLNPREMSAMGNLHDIYLEQGRLAEAAELERRVERYRRENPFYLLHLAEESILANDLESAERSLRKAIRLKPDVHQVHYALARVNYLKGDLESARDYLQSALELAPYDRRIDYRNSLSPLVQVGAPDTAR